MKTSMNSDGMDDFRKSLDNLSKKIEGISGEQNIPIANLFPPDFMVKHSKFETIDELFDNGGFSIDSLEDFERIPEDQWDQYIEKNTDFHNWKSMLEAGAGEWASKQLGF